MLARTWAVLRVAWALALIAGVALAFDASRPGAHLGVTEAAAAVARGTVARPFVLAAALGAALILTLYALLADVYLRWKRRRALATEYVLLRVRRLRGEDFVPRYMREAYVPRRDAADGADADGRARVAVHTAAHRSAHSARPALGVCIFGPSGQGKTRLAWEVTRAELGGWTLLKWSHDAAADFEFRRLRGRRVVLWLDDLHEYATAVEAAVIGDLPRRIEAAGGYVVVVASCRDGADEGRARRHFGGLFEQLAPVRLAGISAAEADQLAAALSKGDVEIRRDQFEYTPGSLVLGVRRLRNECFPRLPAEAKGVLWALALLRRAHIYAYPLWRVRRVAAEIFGVAPANWSAALDAIVAAGYVRVHGRRGGDEGRLVPVSAAYMDAAIPDYLTRNAELSDDWVELQKCFECYRDAEGLRWLGIAFNEEVKGIGPLLPYSLRQEKQQGILCFRAALELCSLGAAPAAWAIMQIELGDALAARAALTEGVLRADFWSQAASALRAAADILIWERAPALWALAQARLARVSERMGTDALFGGDEREAEARFSDAAAFAAAALMHYTPEYELARHRAIAALCDRVEETLKALGEAAE
jgi:hypothetical protein